MSICKIMYFVVLFLFFTFLWYQSQFSLTEIKITLNYMLIVIV